MAGTHPLTDKSEWQNEDADYIQDVELYATIAFEEPVPNMEGIAEEIVKELNDHTLTLPQNAGRGGEGRLNDSHPGLGNIFVVTWEYDGDGREQGAELQSVLNSGKVQFTADGYPVFLYASANQGLLVYVTDEEDRL